MVKRTIYFFIAILVIQQIIIYPVNGQFFTKSQAKSVPRMGRRSEELNNHHHRSVQSVETLIPEETADELAQAKVCSE